MFLTKQPEVFGAKFISGLCLREQLEKLIPEEMADFFAGTLTFPDNDPNGKEIEYLDQILAQVQALLPHENLDFFKA